MAKVIMKSWREGLQKVSLTKLQMELLSKSLTESKNNVDLLLEGQEVSLLVYNFDIAKEFQRSASKLGVDCIVEE